MKVFLATPAMDGNVWVQYHTSMVGTVMALTKAGHQAETAFRCGNANVCLVRNLMASEFMSSDCDVMLFIDADLSWEPQDAINLIESPHDVIGGIYPAKSDELRFNVRNPEPGPTKLMQADGLPTGFLKITRKALKKIAEATPELAFKFNDDHCHAWFDNMIVDGEYFTEDYAFTHRWKQCGGKAFLDPDMTFGHYGHKTFQGNLHDHIFIK